MLILSCDLVLFIKKFTFIQYLLDTSIMLHMSQGINVLTQDLGHFILFIYVFILNIFIGV